MQEVEFDQAAIIQHDAPRAVQTCMRRNLQTGSVGAIHAGDLVDIWISQERRRFGTYRVIRDTGRNVIIGNQGN